MEFVKETENCYVFSTACMNYKFDVPTGSHMSRRVVLCSDHRGYQLKNHVVEYLKKKLGVIIENDVGTHDDTRCDFPDYAEKATDIVSASPLEIVGIGICGSGIGMSAVGGKGVGIISARCISPEDAAESRTHVNSNFLALGFNTLQNLYPDDPVHAAEDIVKAWMETPFEPEEPYITRFLKVLLNEKKKISRIYYAGIVGE